MPWESSTPPTPPAPVRTGNVRPQADRGLDGWLIDRLFGR